MKEISLKRNVVLNVIKTLMGLLFPLITFPYVSRILLPEGIGKVNFALSIISYFSIIASLGIDNYGIREAAKLRNDNILLSQFVKELFFINLISTIISYILFFIIVSYVNKFSEYKILLYVCSTTILFNTLGINWFYSAIEDYLYITIRSIVFQFISLFLLFFLVKTKDDCVIYAITTVISTVGSNILNFLHCRKYIVLRTGKKLEIYKHLKPIFVLFAMAVTTKVYTALDTTMLGFIKGDWEVGIYSAATKINKIVLSLVVSIGAVLLPRLSYYAKEQDKAEFYNLSYKGFEIMFMLAIPCTVGLSLLSESVIIVLCGNEYLDAVLSMRVMNPIIIIIGLSNFIGIQMFMPLNKEKWTLYSVIIGALVNFILNLFLIPKYGALGASIATVVAESFVTLVQILFLKKFIRIYKLLYLFVKYCINSFIMGVFVYFCILFINNRCIQMLVGIFVGCIVYILLLLIEKNTIVMNLISSLKSKKRK